MKILLIIPEISYDPEIVNILTYMLKQCGHEYYISTTIDSSCYDIIITLSRKSLSQIENVAKEHNIPIAHFFTSSTIESEYPEDYNSAFTFFLIKDGFSPIYSVLFPSFIKEIRLNYPVKQVGNYTPQSKLRKKVLVAFDSRFPNYHIFLKILPTINLLSKFDFIVVNVPPLLSNVVNPHVKLSLAGDDDYLYQVDFIIGSGNYVFKAILYQKPCIIVGDRGYGGILDIENFDIQYQHYFQGRAGAELDEHIPPEFLRADIEFLKEFCETLKNSHSELFKKLVLMEGKNTQNLKTALNHVKCCHYQVNHNLQKLRLEQTHAFNFVPTNEEYLMIKTGSNVLYSKISKEDMAIINSFTGSCTYEDAFERLRNKNYDREEFIDFVRELLSEKVLQISAE